MYCLPDGSRVIQLDLTVKSKDKVWPHLCFVVEDRANLSLLLMTVNSQTHTQIGPENLLSEANRSLNAFQ